MEQINSITNQSLVDSSFDIPEELRESLNKSLIVFHENTQVWKNSAFELVVTSENQHELISKASEARKQVSKIRIALEKKRKEMKKTYLEAGRAIDGTAKKILSQITPIENHLIAQEKFVEIKEKAEKGRIFHERDEKLKESNLSSSLHGLDLMSFSDSSFNMFLKVMKERERVLCDLIEGGLDTFLIHHMNDSEFDSLVERISQEVMRKQKEEEKLKIELEKRKREAEENRKKIEELNKKKEEEERARKEAELELQKVRAEENRKKKEEEERARKEALKPDAEKLRAYIHLIKNVNKPELKDKRAQKILSNIDVLIGKIENYVNEKLES